MFIVAFTVRCGKSNEDARNAQLASIERFLSGNNLEYTVIDDVYRVVTVHDPLASPAVENGDSVWFYFAQYKFSSSVDSYLYTNIRDVAIAEEADSTYLSFDPVKTKIRSGDLMDCLYDGLLGSTPGDSLLLLIPSHRAYGNRILGVAPKNQSLAYIINVQKVKKN